MDLKEYMLSRKPWPFIPGAVYYSEVGDMVIAYWKDDPGYAESVSPELTVIRSFETKEVVGVKILGIKPLLQILQK